MVQVLPISNETNSFLRYMEINFAMSLLRLVYQALLFHIETRKLLQLMFYQNFLRQGFGPDKLDDWLVYHFRKC